MTLNTSCEERPVEERNFYHVTFDGKYRGIQLLSETEVEASLMSVVDSEHTLVIAKF